jgi:hypothetical protein
MRIAVERLPLPPGRLDQVFELIAEHDRAVRQVANRRTTSLGSGVIPGVHYQS